MEKKKKKIYKIFILITQYLHNTRVNCILDATFIIKNLENMLKLRLNLETTNTKLLNANN